MATLAMSLTEEGAQPHLPRPAFGIIAALFLGYLAVGFPLPALPLFIHERLGFDSLAVGVVIGIQFVATVLVRGYSGRMTDQFGGKRAAIQGGVFCAAAGALYLVASLPSLPAWGSLAIIVVARLVAGIGESQFVTGCVSWSIASVGPARAGMSMSWTGIAIFAAVSIGAPIGMWLYDAFGLQALMIACMAAPLLAAVVSAASTSYSSPAGQRLPFHEVVGKIWAQGLGLTLHGVGLASLSAFASLYFVSRGWSRAGLVMTCFGVGFIFVRVVFGHLPDRMGGYRVALWSFAVEALGQALLWMAPDQATALAGAMVTGLGCALIYPSLGVEALKRVAPPNRGSAIGAFAAFLDIAYGASSPVAGVVAGHFGLAEVYGLGCICAVCGVALVVTISRRRRMIVDIACQDSISIVHKE